MPKMLVGHSPLAKDHTVRTVCANKIFTVEAAGEDPESDPKVTTVNTSSKPGRPLSGDENQEDENGMGK